MNSEDDFDCGWDNRVTRRSDWVYRTPRFPDREPQLRREARLLPWLAAQLSSGVPTAEVVSESPFTVRHRYVPGGPCPGTAPEHGQAVGRFLRALHALDPQKAEQHGARDPSDSLRELRETLARMERDVLPLLPKRRRQDGAGLLNRMRTPPPYLALVHGDLGPEHIRVVEDRVSGIIDWGDSCVFDPALDLAWAVAGAGPDFSAAVVSEYQPAEDLLERARDWHLLGPWHEVLYGLGAGGPDFVKSGMAGVVSRLDAFL